MEYIVVAAYVALCKLLSFSLSVLSASEALTSCILLIESRMFGASLPSVPVGVMETANIMQKPCSPYTPAARSKSTMEPFASILSHEERFNSFSGFKYI